METTMSADQATAEAGNKFVVLVLSDDSSTLSISLPVDVAVLLTHRLGSACKEAHGYRPAPARGRSMTDDDVRLRLRAAIAAKSEEGAQAIAALEEEPGELDLGALVDLLLEHGCKAEGTK